jgi:vacuolar-type H+-ATPase subunit I/STV1
MPNPPVFSDISLDPLFLSGLAVLLAQALYYAGHWFLGGRAQKERAMEGFEHVILSGVLFGVALILINLSLWGLNTYLSMAGVKPPPGGAIETLNQTKSWQDFGGKVQAALKIAEQTYRSYVGAVGKILEGYMAAVIGTGIVPWTAAVSMAIMNALAYIVTAATTILISAAVYAVAAAMAYGWPALLPVGAVLVTYERTRNLGAWLLALSVVAPVVLAAGADVLKSAVDPSKLPDLRTATPSGAVPLILAMTLLGLIGLVLTVLSYAASRLFDHAGAHLALD